MLFQFRCQGQGSLEPEELVFGAEDDALCVADDELVVGRWVCMADREIPEATTGVSSYVYCIDEFSD